MDDTPPAGPTVNPNRTGLHPGTEWPVGTPTDPNEESFLESVMEGTLYDALGIGDGSETEKAWRAANPDDPINSWPDLSLPTGAALFGLGPARAGAKAISPLIDLLTNFLMGGRRGVSPSIAGPQSTQRLLRSPVRQLSSPTPTRQLTGTGPAGPASRKGEQLSLDL
jgi:hypothetical protein